LGSQGDFDIKAIISGGNINEMNAMDVKTNQVMLGLTYHIA
tara:strand:- start:3054 stop:3176 length:123 start_codon:yes stop_codon:yes gene_type:complete